jgi:outer membrane protein OmpA-like peptidoglycan-associated protein
MMNPTRQRATLAGIALMLCSCAVSSTQLLPKNEGVYALGSRSEFASPLVSQMTPACPALEFARGSLVPSPQHDRVLQKLAGENTGDKNPRFVIAAYCRPGLPPEYARAVSEKRAHAVRQKLIKLGVRPADIQTAGFGNDFARSGPTGDVVVIYNSAP